tara:strand:- start:279 stop:851 length:573 start_codon:yes stop_codon:yes gene_type:complete
MSYKRYIFHNCKNVVYHKNLKTNEVYKKYNINISTYMPNIIRHIILSINDKFNHNYIICPFYSNLYNYQVGMTETGKVGESGYDTIIRGINEECGLNNVVWKENDSYYCKQGNKDWIGVLINNDFIYKPKSIVNNGKDNSNKKVAMVVHNPINSLLNIFGNVNESDIDTDDISGIGFISIYDCKKIINRI